MANPIERVVEQRKSVIIIVIQELTKSEQYPNGIDISKSQQLMNLLDMHAKAYHEWINSIPPENLREG